MSSTALSLLLSDIWLSFFFHKMHFSYRFVTYSKFAIFWYWILFSIRNLAIWQNRSVGKYVLERTLWLDARSLLWAKVRGRGGGESVCVIRTSRTEWKSKSIRRSYQRRQGLYSWVDREFKSFRRFRISVGKDLSRIHNSSNRVNAYRNFKKIGNERNRRFLMDICFKNYVC